MDREAREQANRTLREKLMERFEANRGLMGAHRDLTLERFMGRKQKAEAPPEQEEGEQS